MQMSDREGSALVFQCRVPFVLVGRGIGLQHIEGTSLI